MDMTATTTISFNVAGSITIISTLHQYHMYANDVFAAVTSVAVNISLEPAMTKTLADARTSLLMMSLLLQ